VVWLAVVVSRQNYNYKNYKSKSIMTIIAKIIVICEYCGVCDGCGCFESSACKEAGEVARKLRDTHFYLRLGG
jgi:hypothetical protein